MASLSTGHGERTELPADYMRVADSWARGVMHTSRYPDTTVGDPVEWTLDAHDGSWLFRFHNMEYLYCILRAFEETGREAYRDLVMRIVTSWIAAHRQADSSTAPWMKHTTAMRAQALAYCSGTIPASDEYVAALRQHGAFLAEPANYSGAWNHGFDESLALLAVGATVGEQPWIDLAVRRASEAIETMCDLQGATNEQASVYHFYVWKQFGQFEEELDRCGIEHPVALRRRPAILDFLVHASQPNGRLVAVGDALETRVPSIPGTPLEYAASQGEQGDVPSRRVQVFDRGWAFARTGWGIDRPFAEESMLTLRFGPGRAVHGHSDHTGFHFFTGGREVVGDAGFSGYANPERRAYELNEFGHSQVVVAGAGAYRATAPSTLVQHTQTPQWTQFVLLDNPYRGVARRRVLTMVDEARCVVVLDDVKVPGDAAIARQLLHLGATLTPAGRDENVSLDLRDEHGTVTVRHLLPVSNVDVACGTPGSTTVGWVGIGLKRYRPGTVLTSRGLISGGRCRFATAICADPSVLVSREGDDLLVGGLRIPVPRFVQES